MFIKNCLSHKWTFQSYVSCYGANR